MQRVKSSGAGLDRLDRPRGSTPERPSPASSSTNLHSHQTVYQPRTIVQFRDNDSGVLQGYGSKDNLPAASRLQGASQPTRQQTEEEAEHPRGHNSWHKRVRLVAMRAYHSLRSPRIQGLLAAVVLLVVIGLLSGLFGSTGHQEQQAKYAVYVDGGSSGTRVHVFEYTMSRWPAYVELVLPEKATSVEPGLSSYSGRPEQAAESLKPLIDFALAKIPEEMWSTTPVFLLATAGLRLLSTVDAAAILEECSRTLAATPLMHRQEWATIISGDAEGVFAWTAVNYVSGALEEASLHHHHSRKEMLPPDLYQGVLELGGASFQITFMPAVADAHTRANGSKVPLPGVSNRVFTHSYLGLGMDSAMQSAADLVSQRHMQQENKKRAQAELQGGSGEGTGAVVAWDPCLPKGYQAQDGRMGDASFEGCMAVVQQVLPERLCSAPGTLQSHHDSGRAALLSGGGAVTHSRPEEAHAPGGREVHGTGDGSCTFAGFHVPHVAGTRFIALENFFWTARALGLGPSSTLAELREAGVAHCARPWATLHERFAGHVPDQFLTRYCFGAVYVYLLLHDRLGINEHHRMLQFTNTIRRRKLKRHSLPSPTIALIARGDAAASRSGRGLEGVEEEMEVGLTWVVGAALHHAMNVGRHGTTEFFQMEEELAGAEVGTSGPFGGRWVVLLPVGLGLLLLGYVLHGRMGRRAGRQGMSSGGGAPPASNTLTRNPKSGMFAVFIDSTATERNE